MQSNVFSLDHVYIKGNGFRGKSQPVEDMLADRINSWTTGASLELVNRVFPIIGIPGVGKTWLLHYLTEKTKGAYIDLGSRLSVGFQAFIKDVEKNIDSSKPFNGRKLLLIDHVPARRDDQHLLEFQDRILLPWLRDRDAMAIMAQQHPRVWCWIPAVPHLEPYILNGFVDKGRTQLLKTYCEKNKIQRADAELFSISEMPPLLTRLWRDASGVLKAKESSEAYLKYWLDQMDPSVSSNLQSELRIAGGLTWLNVLVDSGKISQIGEIVGYPSINHNEIKTSFVGRQWITSLFEWEEVPRKILHTWFLLTQPLLVQNLNKLF